MTVEAIERQITEKEDRFFTLMNEVDTLRAPYDGGVKMMGAEDLEKQDRMLKDADGIQEEITNLRKQRADEMRYKAHKEWMDKPKDSPAADAVAALGRTPQLADASDPTADADAAHQELLREGFKTYIKGGIGRLANDMTEGAMQFKALQADGDAEGGYIITPRVVSEMLIKDIDDQVYLRQLATVIPIMQGQSLGAPTLEEDISDPEWTSELDTGDDDTVKPFGMRELEPRPLAKRVRISNKLLNAPGIDAEMFWRSRLAYKFAVAQENAMLNGSGANQPLGIFTAHEDGIPTGRDVNSGATDGITADSLIDLQHKVKAAYWRNSKFLFHRDIVALIRKLKDGDNQYLWQPGLAPGNPGMILGFEYIMSEFAPSTVSTNSYVGMFGDFSKIWIADSLQMTTQRLVELYAGQNQVGFIGRLEMDAQPVLAEAFSRLKVST